ncbi:cache domain-containing sensor histidine kinase [Cohnella hashimotonis]|uniref:Sensor histidine kinase n=1 Tax=Cohnella hashimotonis TaxID=2826895 RepID=A0ABT6TCF5_9BACL|nr:sensor histidine kinase [Cohnella hashimotonis]MDI4644507.1 sensor histidine kinase [Cohnella hashimotonis]
MKKALLFVVVLILVPMLLIFWVASDQASLSIKQQTGKAFFELNRQNHATMDRVLDSIDQTTVALIASDAVQKWNDVERIADDERVQRYVATEKLLADYSSQVKYSLFVMTDRVSEFEFAPNSDVSDGGVFFVRDFKDIPWLNTAIQASGLGTVSLIDKFGFKQKPQKTMAYTRAVTDISLGRKTTSVLVATAIENKLKTDMNAFALPKGTDVFLVNADNEVLAGTAALGSKSETPETGKVLFPGVRITGNVMHIFHDSVAYNNRLIYDIPVESLVGAHKKVQEILQLSAVCYFIVVMFFFFYLGKSFFRPMARLASLTRSYEPGQAFASFGEADRKDEIGFVYRTFYKMTQRLNQLVKEKYLMEIKQKESELMLMHSQITPHLLYNTLDSVYWYGIRGGVPEVAHMVRDLSTMLRIGLSRGKEIITIREELNHVEAYLNLQEKRYEGSFLYRINLEEGADAYLLPKVVIQPLVENSILHGVGKMDGEGEVAIDIRVSGGLLLIAVEDNGFRPVDLAKIEAILSGTADQDKGFGIRNVHKRIQLRFGDAYGLSFEAREEGGTRALIRLPAVLSESEIKGTG